MKMRVWHLSDIPRDIGGVIYLHHEVENFMGQIMDGVPEQDWVAPDLANTDAAGLTTFVAAFGLGNVGTADVVGCGRLAEYPRPIVFVGIATKYNTSSVLRLRGLVVNLQHKNRIITYIKSKIHTRENGSKDILL